MTRTLVGALVLCCACARGAPSWSPVEVTGQLTVVGSSRNVSMARIELRESDTFRFAAGACQEVLIVVSKGVARAELEWFEVGDAARFLAPGVVQATSTGGATLFAVAVNHDPTGLVPPSWTDPPTPPACPAQEPPVVRSDPTDSGPFVHASGRLEVMIFLDGRSTEDEVASLGTLTGSADLGVPEHVHEQSAEVLWIVDGSGRMRLGDGELPIEPGTFVFVPSGTIHGFVPDGTRDLFAYQVYVPAGPEQRFRTPR